MFLGQTKTVTTQQTRDAELMLVQFWARVEHDGPTLNQHWFNVSYLLGRRSHQKHSPVG